MTSRVSWRGALLPAIVALASYILFRLFTSEPRPRGSAFDFGFDVNKVMNLNIETASRSWEVGAAAEALLELHNPDLTVYTRTPFPAGKLPRSHDMTTVRALRYIRPAIWTNGSAMLTEGEGEWCHRQPCFSGFHFVMSGMQDYMCSFSFVKILLLKNSVS